MRFVYGVGSSTARDPEPPKPLDGPMISALLKTIFYELGIDNRGDRYETMHSPIADGVIVYIWNFDKLIAQFDIPYWVLASRKPKEIIERLAWDAVTSRSLGAGWHGVGRPVVWS